MAKYFQKGHEFCFDKVTVKHAGGAVAQKEPHCCSTCGKKATLFVSQVDGFGKVTQKKFCLYHAIAAELFHPKAWDLLQRDNPLHHPSQELLCKCGMTASLLRSKGRAGCARCYTTFAAILKPLLPKIHGATAHAGKAPKKAPQTLTLRRRIEILQHAMKKAVALEAYEEAAVMRDQLADLAEKVK